MYDVYKKQVALLLKVLPLVAKETCFALHGGTAINLFVLDMPRLSVDIDLTYIQLEERSVALANIEAALLRIKERIEKTLPDTKATATKEKLYIEQGRTAVKIEANIVKRGVIFEPVQMELCSKAQNEFGLFVSMPVVHIGQLYGGKICAALDRQHPRDLFDIKLLFDTYGITDEIREGVIFSLVGSDRPMHEVIVPNYIDQKDAMKNRFEGMTDIPFSYKDFQETREKLVDAISACLTEQDKEFLLGFENCAPNWSIYDFERFPAVQWKLQHRSKLKIENYEKHLEQHEALRKKLGL